MQKQIFEIKVQRSNIALLNKDGKKDQAMQELMVTRQSRRD